MNTQKQILFYLRGDYKLVSLVSEERNPGIGGTEFLIIQLAFIFNKLEYRVYLNSDFPVIFEKSNSIITDLSNIDFSNLTVITAQKDVKSFKHEFKDKLDEIFKVLIWIHHPHQFLFHSAFRSYQYVSIGSYQHRSLIPLSFGKIACLPNLFYPIQRQNPIHFGHYSRSLANSKLNFVFLGALLPAKGFHHVLRNWKTVLEFFPNSCLHVIGSGDLYGDKDIKKGRFPTNPSYARKLASIEKKYDLPIDSVIYHGKMGNERFSVIEKCHFALLNPTGKTEAFPASTLECMSLGVPVIASGNYGMYDSMYFFPELSLTKKSLQSIMLWIYDNPEIYIELVQRAIEISKFYSALNQFTLSKWTLLTNSKTSYKFSPPLSLNSRSRFKLIFNWSLKIMSGFYSKVLFFLNEKSRILL